MMPESSFENLRPSAEDLRNKTIRDRCDELFAERPEVFVTPAEPIVETPAVVDAPLGFIEVRTLQWQVIDGFRVKAGYETTVRPRTENDGEALYVVVETEPPKLPESDEQPETLEEWRQRRHREGLTGFSHLDARVAGSGAPDRIRNPSTFRSAKEYLGFSGVDRNAGVIRAGQE